MTRKPHRSPRTHRKPNKPLGSICGPIGQWQAKNGAMDTVFWRDAVAEQLLDLNNRITAIEEQFHDRPVKP